MSRAAEAYSGFVFASVSVGRVVSATTAEVAALEVQLAEKDQTIRRVQQRIQQKVTRVKTLEPFVEGYHKLRMKVDTLAREIAKCRTESKSVKQKANGSPAARNGVLEAAVPVSQKQVAAAGEGFRVTDLAYRWIHLQIYAIAQRMVSIEVLN